MDTFKGYIERIVYRNDETGYAVMTGYMGGKTYTLVGSVPGIEAGENIQAEIHESEHQIYGKQYVIEHFRIVQPGSADAVERYLGSGTIRGIGEALAARIVKKFGNDTMRIIEEEPERLAEVKGISDKKAIEIAASIAARKNMQDAVMFLQDYGVSVRLAGKIYACYGNETYDIIRKNPYRLAEEVEGIGFRTCDDIARRMGMMNDDPFRIQAGIEYTLTCAENAGHCYYPIDELTEAVQKLLNIYIEDIKPYLLSLQMGSRVVVKDAKVYKQRLYTEEMHVAVKLKMLMVRFSEKEEHELLQILEDITTEQEISLDDLQKQAAAIAAAEGLLIITGGPGTGKTTTINTIIRMFREADKTILLAAPTGRAAKRMSEATGYAASTIHRLLEYQGRVEDEEDPTAEKTRGHFERNELNPLECDVLIIDEMSMVDIHLMNSLLKAVEKGTRLILVGDANQLLSVGAGNVLRDMIQSERVRTIQLKHIFRQAAESDIIVNAHRINEGMPVELGKSSRDFLFIRNQEPEKIFATMVTLLTEKLPGYLDVDPFEIQIMSPQKKGALGVENLNVLLQEKMNPLTRGKKEKQVGNIRYRTGDKVMQVKNDYNLIWEIRGRYGFAIEKGEGVFNGDIGRIEDIDEMREILTVKYDDRFVEYRFKDCENLELAYAITIHKSQGSEYPAVIIPMYQGPQMLMNRNLLYTAVTRARNCVCLVGYPEIFNSMLNNATETRRYSSLADRIKEDIV